ncbi:MAG: hypothetical protein AAF586_05995 [Planctomycetota bacterium]
MLDEILTTINDDKPPIRVFASNQIFCFDLTNRQSGTGTFGGKLPSSIKYMTEQAELHKVLEFETPDIIPNQLPLIFGFRHDNCEISYQVENDGTVNLKKLEPPEADAGSFIGDRQIDGWPYLEYPSHFPLKHLSFSGLHQATFKEFLLMTPNHAVHEGDETWIHVLIGQYKSTGQIMWGEHGDYVEVVFNVEPISRYVFATTQVT